jgi:hypothetical protein
MNRKQAIEVAVKSGGNKTANKPGSAPAKVGKTNPGVPAKTAADGNKTAAEPTSVDMQQADPWAKARLILKERIKKS